MLRNLNHAKGVLNNIKFLQKRFNNIEKELIGLVGQQQYTNTKQFFDNAQAKLLESMRVLPAGHRYKGTFYVRKPYSVPVEFEKIDGAAFMREDLISWKIEGDKNSSYYRNIFKEPDLETEITKEDASLVYMEL